MTRRRFKAIVWIVLALLLFSMATAAAVGASRLLAYFQQGADPASALNIVPNKPLDWPVEVTWRADRIDSQRQIEPLARSQIEAAYIRAWLQWTFSYQKEAPFGLSTFFTGPALAEIGEAVTNAAMQDLVVEHIAIRHDLEITFYSADGSLIAFTDHAATIAQTIHDKDGNPVYRGEDAAVYDVVMYLEEGRWKVRHLLRRAAAPAVQGTSARIGISEIVGVNYYPQATPWDLFWTEYDPVVTAADLDRMADLGFNTLRTFIPYEQFGENELDEALLANVDDFMAQAAAADMGVILTLFDFRADYGLLSWPHADRHAEAIVRHFAGHPALLAWDIKNEPNLDYVHAGQAAVDAWLAHTVALVKRFDALTPVTIGWSSAETAHTLASDLDFVSFHYYGLADQYGDRYQNLRDLVGNAPIVVTEFGLPTWNSPFFPNGHTEAEQAAYYADMLTEMQATDGAGYMAWTLYDFTHVPAGVAGRMPWQRGPQRKMGLINVDGEAKLAAELFSAETDLSSVPPIPAYARWLKPFWLTTAFTLIVTISMLVFWYQKKRKTI